MNVTETTINYFLLLLNSLCKGVENENLISCDSKEIILAILKPKSDV